MGDPDLSVVVPVYNDPAGVETTLASLIDQTIAPENYEVLVVDNGSTDQTPAVIQTYAREYQTLVTGLEETEIRSSYAARNRGIEYASGDYIAFIDADMLVDTDWAEMVLDTMRGHGWQYMGCAVEVYPTDDSLMSQFSSVVDFQVERHLEHARFAPTCSLVVDAQLFDYFGPFDQDLISSGDVEFGRRVNDAGVSQHFAPDIVVYHPASDSIVDQIRRHWRVGRGFGQLRRRHPNQPVPSPSLWKTILPPRPSNFFETYGAECSSVRKTIIFYLLEYLVQLSRAGGRIQERLVH